MLHIQLELNVGLNPLLAFPDIHALSASFIPLRWSKLGFNVNRDANAVKVTIDIAKDQLEKASLAMGDMAGASCWSGAGLPCDGAGS